MIYKSFTKIYYALFIVIIVTFIYMFVKDNSVKENLNKNIDTLSINIVKELSKNSLNRIYKILDGKPILKSITKNKKIKKEIDEALSEISTKYFNYVYILYRDKKGIYRFLADGSKGERGELGQPLNINKKEWDRVYLTKKDLFIKQKKFDALWGTYLQPILYKNRVVAIMAVDFSISLPKTIEKILSPFDISFKFIFVSIVIFITLFIMQLYFNYKIKSDSYIDQLTKTYNRYYLLNFINTISIENYQILMFDIDYFKKINDLYGYNVGDFILKKVAKIAKKFIKPDDRLIRYGGEEFIIFIKVTDEPNIGIDLANKLKMAIENEKFYYNNHNINITISLGLNINPIKNRNIDEAIKYCDQLLYIAKKDGRNCIRYSNDKNSNLNSKISIYDIKEALDEKRVICFYQPIFDANSLEIVKYEALVRIVSKDEKIITPFYFLEQIFGTTLYTELTGIVIDKVFEQIKNNKIKISLNLNFSDIISIKNYAILIEKLKLYHKYTNYLIIELLEYEKIENMKMVQERIKEIKSYGVQIALDDFGSGYANYEIFKYLPIDIVKIDGNIIKDMPSSQISQKIVKSILTLTNELKIETVAEFVCSKDVFEFAKSYKIKSLQGFYLSKPKEII